MLRFFPAPYPDETIYGTCGRYHSRCGNASPKATMQELFGSLTACATVDLPNRLENLCNSLSRGTLITPDKLINENTMLPLYRPFLPKARVDKITKWMKGATKGGSIHATIGVTASTVPHPRYLRLCIQCLKSDEEKFGEAYWHRCHQVAGVQVCHHHGNPLCETEFPVRVQFNKHFFYPVPNSEICNGIRPGVATGADKEKYLRIAATVAWLLSANSSVVPGLGLIRRRYLDLLRLHDLATHSGRVYQEQLLPEFKAYYGDEFLEEIGCGVELLAEDNWLSKMVRKPRTAAHPLKHILLMHFLGVDAEEFFKEGMARNHPFGRGPWPCLNPVAQHYRKPVVTRCIVTRNSECGRPVGNFICSCGFCYARTGPDKGRNDRFRLGRMIQFGPVWEKELLSCWNKGAGLRATARYLGVTSKTVKRAITALEHGKARKTSGCLDELEMRRMRWGKLRASFPSASRKTLRHLAKADYAWLYRHDRCWLNANLPPPMPHRKNGRSRVNWAQRDWAAAAAIHKAAREIRTRAGKPVKVTVSSLGKSIGLLFNLQHKLHKLPVAERQLHKACESKEQFALRRVQRAVESLKGQGGALEVWRIMRAAGLRSDVSPIVRREIERLIRKHIYES